MIAYGFIAEIDDFFAQSLKDYKLKGEAQEETFQVQPDEETLTKMKETPLKLESAGAVASTVKLVLGFVVAARTSVNP